MIQKKKLFQFSAVQVSRKGALVLIIGLAALLTMGISQGIYAQNAAVQPGTTPQAVDAMQPAITVQPTPQPATIIPSNAVQPTTLQVNLGNNANVTLYGVIDANIADSTVGDSHSTVQTRTVFGQGLFNGSRWGIKGSQDLGNGNKAIFDLESGFYLGTAVADQQGQLFGRQAWVGLESSTLGQLTMGRTYGTFSDAIGLGDVFTAAHGNLVLYKPSAPGTAAGNYGGTFGQEDTFFENYSGLRWDESVKYTGKFWGVTVGGQYAFGNPAGDLDGNCMYAASLGYDMEKLKAVASFQNENDGMGRNHHDVGGGLQCSCIPAVQLYGFYFQSNYDRGFGNITVGDEMIAGTAVTTTGIGSTAVGTNSELSGPASDRQDQVLNVAAKYAPASDWEFTASYFNDFACNVESEGDSGTRDTYMLVADYYLSKQSDIYAAYAYSNLTGVVDGTVAGQTNYSAASGMFAADGVNVAQLYTLGTRYRF